MRWFQGFIVLPNNEEQVAKVEEALKGISYEKIWLFIPTLDWGNDKEKNKKFIEDMADETLRKGKFLGIYTSERGWRSAVGDWARGSRYSLWWIKHDGNPLFNNFKPFGGWYHCFIKEYSPKRSKCFEYFQRNYR